MSHLVFTRRFTMRNLSNEITLLSKIIVPRKIRKSQLEKGVTYLMRMCW